MGGRWFRSVLYLLRRARMADELQEEIETHRTLRQSSLEREGVADAASASRRALGNVTLAREDAREVWITRALDAFVRDIRYGIRGLGRRPGFALPCVCTIAIGTGALASVLSVVHTVLLRPPSYRNADRLVQIGQVSNGRYGSEVSTVDVIALREGSPSLSHVTIAWFSEASLSGDGLPERARRVYTDWQGFHMLGVQPLIGRLPSASDEDGAADPVAVIGHRLWSERFGSDRGIIGRTLRVDAQPHVVIAVMPEGFAFPAPYWPAGDLWLLRGPSHPSWPISRARTVLAFGLLRDGATIERAQAEADTVAAGLDVQYQGRSALGLRLTTWAETQRAAARPRVWLIVGVASVVFLIVCANVAGLLLSRGLERERELAARMALGAGAGRLARQLLTETGVLFVLGGAAGLVAAVWGSQLLVSLRSFAIPRMEESAIDLRVAATAMAVTLAAAAVVGLVPVLQAAGARFSVQTAGTRGGSHAYRWRRVQQALVTVQIGLALVLLCGAGVLLEGARDMARIDPGFDAGGLLHARVALPREKYPGTGSQVAFYERAIAQLLASPGIVAAGAVDVPPGVGGNGGPSLLLDGDPAASSADGLQQADVRVATAGYLEALGLAPRAGRFFSSSDRAAPPIAVVNETLARRYFAGHDAVGRTVRITLGGAEGVETRSRTIVGIAPDVKETTLHEPAPPTIYVPITQIDSPPLALRMTLVARPVTPGAAAPAVLRAAIARADGEQAVSGIATMAEVMAEELSLARLMLALVGVLSAVALFLAVVGVYGLTAYSVRQRTREIGIRLALGGQPGTILRLVLRDGAALALLGVASGLGAAVWSLPFLRSQVPGLDQTSPGAFASAGLVLAGAVLAASYLPSRRATHVDPAIVLRVE